MDVLHISAADLEGGAARAAYRIHKSLLKYHKSNEVNSLMRVISKKSDDDSVLGGYPIYTNKIWTKMVPHLNKIPKLGFKTDNPATHTTSLVSSGLGKEMEKRYKKNKNEILNIYWIGDKTISINEISKLRQTTVWTLFDQWGFSGAEHYQSFPDNEVNETERFIDGYSKQNRPKDEKGIDINRLVWETKKRAFKNPINIVCCSNWLANCAKESSLMRNWPIEVIPIPIDLKKYSPIDKSLARKILNLPSSKPLILFGAIRGTKDPRKGADLLFKALEILRQRESKDPYLSSIELMIFGQNKKFNLSKGNFPIHFFGHLSDDISLRILYSASDLLVVPSRLEALGQTAVEAHACGRPVVGFNYGGLVDVIENRKTGSLANPFDPYNLANEIKWVLENETRKVELGNNARQRAEKLWSEERISKLYSEYYKKIKLYKA